VVTIVRRSVLWALLGVNLCVMLGQKRRACTLLGGKEAVVVV
jgi:hypothetical protein